MLNKLKLTNFRRHRDLVIDFTTGMNIMRAANEGGKSTTLESVSYALFGAKALRTPIEQAVTWGEPVNSLKVELTITIEGVTYVFTRSKTGAEVSKNGEVFCTGQTEVTTLAATLLGADAGMASKLLMASQNSIRGALDEGPKALSVLIEDLSDMSVFDQILEAASEKLALGSPNLLEERLKGAEATREAAMQNLPPKPDTDQFESSVQALNQSITKAKQSIPELMKRAASSEAVWLEAAQKYQERMNLEATLTDAEKELARANEQVQTLSGAANIIVTDSREALRAELAEALDFSKRKDAHDLFVALPDGDRYDGSAVEFEAVSGIASKELGEVAGKVSTLERELISVKAKRINHDKCDKCGQDVTHLAHVIQTNADVDAKVATLTAELDTLNTRKAQLTEDTTKFNAVERYATRYAQAIAKVGSYVTLNEETYPAKAAWGGGIPSGSADVQGVRARLAKMESEIQAAESAKSKFDLAVEQQTAATGKVRKAKDALAACDSPTAEEFVELGKVKDNDALTLLSAKGEIIVAESEVTTLTEAHTNAVKLWSMAQSRIDDADKVIAECKADLGSLGFNNALVKRLRAIRPIVANRVWSLVLSSVSVMFSQMRGEPSVVSKDTSGFKVNGQAVESLSGSTLDILGVALRCALLRTFVPQCGLMVLDEPAQGCDETRTENLLGFLQSLGMTQTLLVTHEEISMSVADNIIEL